MVRSAASFYVEDFFPAQWVSALTLNFAEGTSFMTNMEQVNLVFFFLRVDKRNPVFYIGRDGCDLMKVVQTLIQVLIIGNVLNYFYEKSQILFMLKFWRFHL